MERPTLFEFAGGSEAFLRLAAAHHQGCLDDPLPHHPFSHPGHPRHVERLASYWAEVLGGPPVFSESCGGQPAMLHLHARTQAEDDMGDRFLACFTAALDDAGLPDDAHFRRALVDYMRWATGDVMGYAPADAVVPEHLAVPRWGWDGPVTADV